MAFLVVNCVAILVPQMCIVHIKSCVGIFARVCLCVCLCLCLCVGMAISTELHATVGAQSAVFRRDVRSLMVWNIYNIILDFFFHMSTKQVQQGTRSTQQNKHKALCTCYLTTCVCVCVRASVCECE